MPTFVLLFKPSHHNTCKFNDDESYARCAICVICAICRTFYTTCAICKLSRTCDSCAIFYLLWEEKELNQ